MRSPVVREGFWLPKALRERVCSTGTAWERAVFAGGRECGRECEADAPDAVAAQWPALGEDEWSVLLEGLAEARRRLPRGRELWDRLQVALRAVPAALAGPGGTVCADTAAAISRYTGYSPAMVASVLTAPDMWELGGMAQAFANSPTRAALHSWEPMSGLPGRVRFTPASPHVLDPRTWLCGGPVIKATCRMPGVARRPLFGEAEPPGFVLGYGAGNVPGTALMIVLLALSVTLADGAAPVVVVRNSRREPLFSPLVLGALEEVDEAVVSTVAVLVWDYDDPALQQALLGRADLVIAAAGDETIAQIGRQITAVSGRPAVGRRRRVSPANVAAQSQTPPEWSRAVSPGRPWARPRFHAHGHKVSFSVIGREMLATGDRHGDLPEGVDLLDTVALLAALDSVFWDQNGCLSSRIHFVETGGAEDRTPLEYAECLADQLRRLSQALPRGAWPRRQLHDTFDRYTSQEAVSRRDGGLRVVSAYEDPFVVVLDERGAGTAGLDRQAFSTLVNDCQGRVVVVRPVGRLLDVPERYLKMLPPWSLQSLSVAVGTPGEGLAPRILEFASACADRGVTALRVVGRGAFPQLAYSWDGLLPLDLISRRPRGYFTTIEFDTPFEDMMRTYRAVTGRLAGPPLNTDRDDRD